MNYLGKEFHRRSALDASKDQKNASKLLKSATKGESLQEWFDKEKKKPAPKNAEDAFSGNVVKRVGGYKIVEGVGVNGGQWLVEGRGERKIYSNRQDAEEHASQEED